MSPQSDTTPATASRRLHRGHGTVTPRAGATIGCGRLRTPSRKGLLNRETALPSRYGRRITDNRSDRRPGRPRCDRSRHVAGRLRRPRRRQRRGGGDPQHHDRGDRHQRLDLWGANSMGTASARATVPAGTTLPAGQTFVFANTGHVHGAGRRDVRDRITNTGGSQIRDAAARSWTRSALHRSGGVPRGGGLAQPASGAGGFARKNGGTQDTDDNVADFTGPLTPTPTKCGSTCAARSRRGRATLVRMAPRRSPPSRRSATTRRAKTRW